jgi:hypothetical protein
MDDPRANPCMAESTHAEVQTSCNKVKPSGSGILRLGHLYLPDAKESVARPLHIRKRIYSHAASNIGANPGRGDLSGSQRSALYPMS